MKVNNLISFCTLNIILIISKNFTFLTQVIRLITDIPSAISFFILKTMLFFISQVVIHLLNKLSSACWQIVHPFHQFDVLCFELFEKMLLF